MISLFVDTLRQNKNCFYSLRKWFAESHFLELAAKADSADAFARLIARTIAGSELPSYLTDLVAMEAHLYKIEGGQIQFNPYPEQLSVNPTLKIFTNSWKHLGDLLNITGKTSEPAVGEEQVMVWRAADADRPMVRPVGNADLLAMKMAVEHLSAQAVAEVGSTTIAAINTILLNAIEDNILLAPKSKIVRSRPFSPDHSEHPKSVVPDIFTSSRVFALQWHITQACDLHCRHCYDRSPSETLALDQEIEILDSLSEFCTTHQVFGQISFTGGNPLLHPHFNLLYREASDRGFFIGILGNPSTRERIDELLAIQPPAFYQMSLEGLEPHNDHIRGTGHFKQVMEFLEVLKKAHVFSKIMLTLTRDNLDQVIALGMFLQNKTDLFTFNRLSQMGEGAHLAMADPEEFRIFLEDYLDAARIHDVFALKDNLFNIVLNQHQSPLYGGCTGYGCGAAFNFVSVLATGEVHACRKFPSPIGDLTCQSLEDIYHGDQAERYRRGPDDCRSCELATVCRGCMAVTHSHTRDLLRHRDPFCFITQ